MLNPLGDCPGRFLIQARQYPSADFAGLKRPYDARKAYEVGTGGQTHMAEPKKPYSFLIFSRDRKSQPVLNKKTAACFHTGVTSFIFLSTYFFQEALRCPSVSRHISFACTLLRQAVVTACSVRWSRTVPKAKYAQRT